MAVLFRSSRAAALFLFLLALAVPGVARATLIRAQAPCTSSQGLCLQFANGSPLTIRQFTTTFPTILVCGGSPRLIHPLKGHSHE
jgi:hypothetical protein